MEGIGTQEGDIPVLHPGVIELRQDRADRRLPHVAVTGDRRIVEGDGDLPSRLGRVTQRRAVQGFAKRLLQGRLQVFHGGQLRGQALRYEAGPLGEFDGNHPAAEYDLIVHTSLHKPQHLFALLILPFCQGLFL